MVLVRVEPKSREIMDLIKSVTITEGSSLVRYVLKDESMLVVDIDKKIIYQKGSRENAISKKEIVTSDDFSWLEFSKLKKAEKIGEVYH